LSQKQKQKVKPSLAVTPELEVSNNTTGTENNGELDSDENLSNASDDVSVASCDPLCVE